MSSALVERIIASTTGRSLKHYGVRGMKWGVRKRESSSSGGSTAPEPVKLKIKPGERVKVAGGSGYSPSADAKAAAAYRQIARKSSPDALSNKQLQALVQRINLEKQYSQVMADSRRKGPVRRLVETIIKGETQPLMTKGKPGPLTSLVVGSTTGTGGKHRKQ